jgi:3-deoxy-D-manno-octulosonic-acid transferase
MFLLYEVLLYLVFIVGLPFFIVSGIVRGKYLTNFPQRLGLYRSPRRPHEVWIHAVSVGETLAARSVVDALERLRPQTSIVFTTTTITGQAQARRLYPNATVTYFPLDFSFSVKRFLDHHQPRVFTTMETELWPNVTRISRKRGLRLMLANGRISDRSFPRYRAFRPVVENLLGYYDRILAREPLDRERFLAIGAPSAAVEITGNVKFDYDPDVRPLEIAPELESLIGGRKVFVLGSTVEGEDEALIPLLGPLVEKGLFIIVAPRKPERFDAVGRLLTAAGIRFVRRSAFPASGSAEALLVDAFGELGRMYGYATVAFVGGTLMPTGGHNPIEPAAAGVPVCFGRSMSNFREIASTFLHAHAAFEAASAAEVIAFAEKMLSDEEQRRAWGGRARQVVLQNRGASERTARRIVELLA